jgi:hypothetical protein
MTEHSQTTVKLWLLNSVGWLRDHRRRRLHLSWIIAVLMVLSVFPQPQLVMVSLTPLDSSSGISSSLGPLGALVALSSHSNGQNISEPQMRVARSVEVRRSVISAIQLNKIWHSNNLAWLEFKLASCVTIRSSRGGILLLEVKGYDADLNFTIVNGYVNAIEQKLTELENTQIKIQKDLLNKVLMESNQRTKLAEERLDEFRRANNAPEPKTAFLSASKLLESLNTMRQSQEMQLSIMRQFQTDSSVEARSVIAQIDEIDRQITNFKNPQSTDPLAINQVIPKTTELYYLTKDVEFSRAASLTYRKLLEQMSLASLSSNLKLRVLEPAHIEPTIQFNWFAVVLMAIILIAEMSYEIFRRR